MTVLIGLAIAVPSWRGLQAPAVVVASYTFRVTAPAAERYEWSLTDNRAPGGQLVHQSSLTLERGELARLAEAPELSAVGFRPALGGGEVTSGQLLYTLHLPRSERELIELGAERDALLARRALLEAGAREPEVEESRRTLELARARLERASAVTDRLRSLSAEGAISEADLQDATLKQAERAREVDVARAALDSARAPARPEAISEIDARLAALDVGVSETTARLESAHIRSPIDGVIEWGGASAGPLLTVSDLDPIYLHIPVPADDFHRLSFGDPLRFATSAIPDREFEGELVYTSARATLLGGAPVIWISAEVYNPDGLLRPGMTGEVELSPRAPGAWGLGSALQAAVDGP